MRGGKLDDRVVLYATVETRDAAGGPVKQPVQPGIAVWADVISLKGDKSFEAAQQMAKRTVKVQLRWRADVTSSWLVEWGGDLYDIVDIDRSLARKGELWLTAVLRSGA